MRFSSGGGGWGGEGAHNFFPERGIVRCGASVIEDTEGRGHRGDPFVLKEGRPPFIPDI